jgi:hypothetical protein
VLPAAGIEAVSTTADASTVEAYENARSRYRQALKRYLVVCATCMVGWFVISAIFQLDNRTIDMLLLVFGVGVPGIILYIKFISAHTALLRCDCPQCGLKRERYSDSYPQRCEACGWKYGKSIISA